MWRSKKFMVSVVVVVMLLAGSIGGLALAAGNGGESKPYAQCGLLLDRVCEIYEQETGDAIDKEELRDAFAQARNEMREEAMQNRLRNLVEQGKITDEQADELEDWWQSRPDVPIKPGFRGQGGFRGMGRPCAPAE